MEPFVFQQLAFVRKLTLKAAEGLTEEMADIVPDGFRNSLRWQLGHLYVVLERFAFKAPGLPQQLPDGFRERFEFGTSPLTWAVDAPLPTLPELRELLAEQPARVEALLAQRLREEVAPYTTSTGFTLSTPGEFLGLALYHEGLHQGAVKLYKTILSR
ncbi:DinB family protein [Paenibacillus sp. LHD-117]|uniref:DinB family protein n=1 Tax=Paenibacillus sp. LHD-117 TaxID=3071412 RepID=UPI0027DFDE57|nr:DinB family protein [Paenibacillus sp. LHD-117]MDQ6419651.1 DinB family protein [Paenibacillus sp. LHD-117]